MGDDVKIQIWRMQHWHFLIRPRNQTAHFPIIIKGKNSIKNRVSEKQLVRFSHNRLTSTVVGVGGEVVSRGGRSEPSVPSVHARPVVVRPWTPWRLLHPGGHSTCDRDKTTLNRDSIGQYCGKQELQDDSTKWHFDNDARNLTIWLLS